MGAVALFAGVYNLEGENAAEHSVTLCHGPSLSLSHRSWYLINTLTGAGSNMPGNEFFSDWLESAMDGLRPLSREYFLQPAEEVARGLLGCLLMHEIAAETLVARIVETEAYLAEGDPGCHAARGRTERNAPMFGPPGTAYVYMIYGMHLCMNLVTGPEGTPAAVLLRAAEPLMGIETMRRLRGRDALKDLCSGPAKLAEAFGITLEHNRKDITGGRLYVTAAPGDTMPEDVLVTTRVGLGEGAGDDLMLRYLIPDSQWVSRSPRRDAPVNYQKR